LQKRPRKLIVTENVDESDESDEYFTEHDTKSISDFTDSEDEWGAMNQPKNKVKPLRTSSKLVELEKKLLEKEKMLKYDTNNLLDANQNNEYNGYTKTLVCSKNKDDKSFLEVKETKPITLGKIYFFKLKTNKKLRKNCNFYAKLVFDKIDLCFLCNSKKKYLIYIQFSLNVKFVFSIHHTILKIF